MTLPKTMRRNGVSKEEEKDKKRKKKTGKKTKKQASLPLYKNPWDFADSIPLLEEDLMLNKDDLVELDCRLNYSIKCLSENDTDKTELLYKIFSEQVGENPIFMRNWVRLYAVTNRKQLENISKEYLYFTGSKVTTWLQGVKEGRKGKHTYSVYIKPNYKSPLLCPSKGKELLDYLKGNTDYSC